MHPAATEPGHLTHRVHTPQGCAVRAQHSSIQVGFQPAEGLSRQHVQPDSDQQKMILMNNKYLIRYLLVYFFTGE